MGIWNEYSRPNDFLLFFVFTFVRSHSNSMIWVQLTVRVLLERMTYTMIGKQCESVITELCGYFFLRKMIYNNRRHEKEFLCSNERYGTPIQCGKKKANGRSHNHRKFCYCYRWPAITPHTIETARENAQNGNMEKHLRHTYRTLHTLRSRNDKHSCDSGNGKTIQVVLSMQINWNLFVSRAPEPILRCILFSSRSHSIVSFVFIWQKCVPKISNADGLSVSRWQHRHRHNEHLNMNTNTMEYAKELELATTNGHMTNGVLSSIVLQSVCHLNCIHSNVNNCFHQLHHHQSSARFCNAFFSSANIFQIEMRFFFFAVLFSTIFVYFSSAVSVCSHSLRTSTISADRGMLRRLLLLCAAEVGSRKLCISYQKSIIFSAYIFNLHKNRRENEEQKNKNTK